MKTCRAVIKQPVLPVVNTKFKSMGRGFCALNIIGRVMLPNRSSPASIRRKTDGTLKRTVQSVTVYISLIIFHLKIGKYYTHGKQRIGNNLRDFEPRFR